MFNLPIGLRAKVGVLSLFLLCLPWLGYEYVWEMEKYLRLGQEKTLEGTTQALATALHERPKLFDSQASFLTQVEKGRDLYAYPLAGPIQLDGKLGDWQPYRHSSLHYGEDYQVYKHDPAKPLGIEFTHMVGKYAGYLYGFFEVTDPQVIYRGKNSLSIDRNDHIAIATLAPDGQFRRYVVATTKDGWISAFELPEDPALTTPVTPEVKIQGKWLKSAKGYNVELRIPLEMVGSKLGFAIYDVNDSNTRQLEAIVGTSAIDDVNKLGTVLVPSPEIESIIKGMAHNSSRIWVVDRHGRVLAKSGDIRSDNSVWARSTVEKEGKSTWDRFKQQYLYPLYYKILTIPAKDFIDSLQDSTVLQGSHINKALKGKQGSTWRLTPDNKAVVLAAASPIWIDDKVMGVVIAEETTHGIRTLRNKALEKLFNVILTIMSMGTLALFFFASNISSRIRKLRDEAERAIDNQGRIKKAIKGSKVRDEIGDLSRSFASIVSRLGEYTHYLENMSSRLSHELRTPVAVVRSSLEHLSLQTLNPDSRKYVDRAQEGVNRLNMILNNMSEATRLEESLTHAEKSLFPLEKVISGCMQGYQMTYPNQLFKIDVDSQAMYVEGVPEYIAQLMDKLIANALEFSTPDSAIEVSLKAHNKVAHLSVANYGTPLPDNMSQQIFESMVSVRAQKAQDKPHLGLGLYIARLISLFHKGKISAQNRVNEQGAVFGVEILIQLPISKEKPA
ncbi:proteobacterial dedicated sortase system histidine kinase [Shewanella sp. Choline-02u-19]|uniref:proteobacterial dedicated sortase system histidine kinase n=1 Tax=unclassified Shewanella TaxID=196818 RepID=UPI000C339184|nr:MULTISPECIES: proteobacterial dedicated sortase system histidine kinase [unclassified Shewanella]PKG56236.1 proteobacterial dedicated sortase system histidine kinase [Shewanella sp. GutDb-MelDb]PKG75646.1 proteobacterial dedicated sortase system histidine kinase [Shewanella sp. GutCb]PKH56504.1 proteobacterial dedicated sortase system histidine kinase [Shewanella sp. Bg11-22]PKI27990.1 proteobacterial dedicated sortase system histidine kinase [Shewanella sp. Choline-02u-19]